MKLIFPGLALVLLAASACNGNKDTRHFGIADTGHLAKSTGKPTSAAPVNNNTIAVIPINNSITLTANDRMQYSDTLFRVRAGQKVDLKFTNIGKMPKSSMGHNFTLLTKGTDLADYANHALDARNTDYQPPTLASKVIAHTRLVGPGESDSISFTLREKGTYDFLCTFPNHYGTLRGKIVAE